MPKTHTRSGKLSKPELRLLKLLSKSARSGLSMESRNKGVFLAFKGRYYEFKPSLVSKIVAKDHAVMGVHTLRITQMGLEAIRAQAHHGETQARTPVKSSNSAHSNRAPEFNDSESPLYRLHRRRGAGGRKYLDGHEFAAGERLRRDFERGQLQPRVTATLGISAGRSKGGGHFHAAEISDIAMDARARFQEAIKAVSPELADVAIDICCFLKGFETVEREKQWPPRSAKLMLKTALAQLSRHYGFSPPADHISRNIIAWGDEGYRPTIE